MLPQQRTLKRWFWFLTREVPATRVFIVGDEVHVSPAARQPLVVPPGMRRVEDPLMPAYYIERRWLWER